RPGVLADVTRILADCGISIEAFVQKEAPPTASEVPVVMLINPVKEKRMNQAIAAIEKL
ncbi:MAG TPA: homoserine dehydrogenase, partial [Candidatus Competibacteraceae bacterium]|nr:homoserine dehydrogenase [Candidatus Competibacteraceae bacterium]